MKDKNIDTINGKVSEYSFLDFYIYAYEKSNLIIACSEDFSYFHNFEIHFIDIFSIICNSDWKANTKENLISIVDGEEANKINRKYRVEFGNKIYKISNSDALDFYIIAKDIKLEDKLVKYFEE